MANSVCHFEILADDLERAKKFYGVAFGWRFEPWGPPDFFVIKTGNDSDPGITEGALAKRTRPAGEGLNGYRCTITVPDLEKAIENIKSAGGEITSDKFDIPGVGAVVSFKDSEGNGVAIVEYLESDPRHVKE